MYLLGCMFMHCMTMVHVKNMLLLDFDLLTVVPGLLCHGTINVLGFFGFKLFFWIVLGS